MGNIISIRPLIVIAFSAVLSACASSPKMPTGPVGPFISPLDDMVITSNFGQRGRRPHYGIDLRADHGTPVAAVQVATVQFAGRQRGFGRLVILNHGQGVTTYYAHLSRIRVKEGQVIRQGETIGFVGSSGNAKSAHLHFEVRDQGQPLDPLGMLATFKVK
ncbi:M23 family metallopeptidase [Parvularcula sp. LCG005]|uniref:M23 family metallopeptidase n=1 Tax=Parvularcula sp. LCG005 TaxID=3078805 RepID=UPI0029431039|nr:M23 family metallopeptidase [Parvularcula sp. LCG005]WOI52889.1 M23 family metallopeptidase [Parvularcula sp. LCG005]